jgi:hypothetical protein
MFAPNGIAPRKENRGGMVAKFVFLENGAHFAPRRAFWRTPASGPPTVSFKMSKNEFAGQARTKSAAAFCQNLAVSRSG